MKNSKIIISLFVLVLSFSLSSCYFFKEKSYKCCDACVIEDYDGEIDYVCHVDGYCAETCEAKCCAVVSSCVEGCVKGCCKSDVDSTTTIPTVTDIFGRENRYYSRPYN